jgi:hypothetical protein
LTQNVLDFNLAYLRHEKKKTDPENSVHEVLATMCVTLITTFKSKHIYIFYNFVVELKLAILTMKELTVINLRRKLSLKYLHMFHSISFYLIVIDLALSF